MLFNSFEFLGFLLVTYTLYRLLPFQKQNILLLVASYVFYASWDVRFLVLIAIATVVDYCCGLMIAEGQIPAAKRNLVSGYLVLAAFWVGTVQWNAVRWNDGFSVTWGQLLPGNLSGWLVFLGAIAAVLIANGLYPRAERMAEQARRNRFLLISLVSNLAILGFFKYFNFFLDSFTGLLSTVGLSVGSLHLNILLPVGISFYTFRTMSYTIDVWRGKSPPEQEFSTYALFLAFFPSLLAGPIDRARDLIPQIARRRSLSFDQTMRGLFLILYGMFKKVAIADGVSSSVNAIYQTTGTVSWIDVIAATVLYAVQIYCDFSGYSDMARGVAKLFGFDLMVNFNLPYFSKDPSEFWRRWHISLSTWLRDYLYISLGGNRKGEFRTYFNLMMTMVLGGLWHGATWNFVLWGFYQGALLCVYRVVSFAFPQPKKDSQAEIAADVAKPGLADRLRGLASMALFFVLTCYGWLLFGVTSFEKIASFTVILFTDIGNRALSMPMPPLAALLGIPILVLYEILEYRFGKPQFYLNLPTPVRGALYAAFIFIVVMGGSNAPAQFIYSKF